MKILSHKKIYLSFMFSMFFLPYLTLASNVYIDTSHTNFFVGDTILFNVIINSENKTINAVEGNILLEYKADSASLIDINLADSKFSLWPSKPLPSIDNTAIYFTGGIPSGLNSNNATILNIVLKLEKVGQIKLTPSDIKVYLNDGKGTKDKISIKDLIINVLPSKVGSKSIDDLSNLLLNDKTPPEPFEIYLGQENSVFEGKKFISFSTVDKQSDIAYYEVMEGNLSPIRASDTYVLQEQDNKVKITVIAYDSAGNYRKSIYGSETNNIIYPVMVIFIALIIIFVVYKRMRRK